MNNSNSTTQITFGAITVDSVEKSQYSKAGEKSAQLRQIVSSHTEYQNTGSSLGKGLFSASELGRDAAMYDNESTRVAWIPVPENYTAEMVVEHLKNFPNARIYKILSNTPILTSGDEALIADPSSALTLDVKADRQIRKYPQGHANAGQIIFTDAGKVQYGVTVFHAEGAEDIDVRDDEPANEYRSKAIKAELAVLEAIPASPATVVDGM